MFKSYLQETEQKASRLPNDLAFDHSTSLASAKTFGFSEKGKFDLNESPNYRWGIYFYVATVAGMEL
jgi:hypothetical protein